MNGKNFGLLKREPPQEPDLDYKISASNPNEHLTTFRSKGNFFALQLCFSSKYFLHQNTPCLSQLCVSWHVFLRAKEGRRSGWFFLVLGAWDIYRNCGCFGDGESVHSR